MIRILALVLFGAVMVTGAGAQEVGVQEMALPDTPVEGAGACPAPPPGAAVLFPGPIDLTLVTDTGAHEFRAEVANSPLERARGMMFRPEMARDAAMLFVDETDQEQSFFMRNTCVSLDLVWIRADLTVAGVFENAEPFSEDRMLSPEPVLYVLEIPGGRAAEIGLKAGDALKFGRAAG